MKKFVLKRINDNEPIGTFASKVDAAEEMDGIIESNNG